MELRTREEITAFAVSAKEWIDELQVAEQLLEGQVGPDSHTDGSKQTLVENAVSRLWRGRKTGHIKREQIDKARRVLLSSAADGAPQHVTIETVGTVSLESVRQRSEWVRLIDEADSLNNLVDSLEIVYSGVRSAIAELAEAESKCRLALMRVE